MRRNKHSLSHYHNTTVDMGKLYPLTVQEALPGDTFQHRTSVLVRSTPLMAPVMHPVMIRIHHWFVPIRLIWDNFEPYITGGSDGKDTTDHPRIDFTAINTGDLADYMGLPVGNYSGSPLGYLQFSALPFRAYNLIYNEHYRDQDLNTEKVISKADGVDTTTDLDILNCSWEKDYFTTCRPWTQKGDEAMIPIGTTAPVISDGNPMKFSDGVGAHDLNLSSDSSPNTAWTGGTVSGGSQAKFNDEGLLADLSQATGVSINDLRYALAIQRYMERSARFGSRYVEYLRSLGVRSSDGRLGIPEYLGGGRSTIAFSEVLQTQRSDEGEDPLGSMAGHGISALRTRRYRRFFEEHGLVLTLFSVVPKSVYTTAVHKKWLRNTKEDYFQKELQHLGEQEVHNVEIQAGHSDPSGIFGYQARYNEYRSHPSYVSGEFNDINNHWHYAREFSGDVALNSSFINCVPTKRVNASTDTNVLYLQCNHSIQARRILAKFGDPKTF